MEDYSSDIWTTIRRLDHYSSEIWTLPGKYGLLFLGDLYHNSEICTIILRRYGFRSINFSPCWSNRRVLTLKKTGANGNKMSAHR